MSDRCLYLATGVLLVCGAAIYVHFDMRRSVRPVSTILIFHRTLDGFDDFQSREMYVGTYYADCQGTPKWCVLGSTNPAKAKFAIVLCARSKFMFREAVEKGMPFGIIASGKKLDLKHFRVASRDDEDWSFATYEGTWRDLEVIAAANSVVFEVGDKKYKMDEADRDVLKALLRAIERSQGGKAR